MGLTNREQLEINAQHSEITFARLLRAAADARKQDSELPSYLVLTKYGQTLVHGEEAAKSVAECLQVALSTEVITVALIAVRA